MPGLPPPLELMCWPGPRATAHVQESGSGRLVIGVFLDPVMLSIGLPPFPDGAVVFARFCRTLSRTTAHAAMLLDPDGSPAPPEGARPRHLLVTKTPDTDEGDGAW